MAVHDLQSIAFPTLDENQISELVDRTGATLKKYGDGERVFNCGDRHLNFLIVDSGAIEIIDQSGDEERRVALHEAGGFTGDVSLLTGNPALVSACARGETEVYEIQFSVLREVLNDWPSMSDIILQAFIARRQLLREMPGYMGIRIIGSRFSPDTFRIRDFLARNFVPCTWVDIENDRQMDELLRQFGVKCEEMPVVGCSHRIILRNPSNRELADLLGIRKPLEKELFDLAVVGAGPAGLAAAVYGASEGLRTVMLERTGTGGQASSSMRIENYLGFPTGITGAALAYNATLQAAKFGANLSVPTAISTLSFESNFPVLTMDDGEVVTAKCLLISTGADYRRLAVEGCSDFEGAGVYYAATPNEAQVCVNSRAVVVGGGNSAGQAAVFLSEQATEVLLLIRGGDLYKNMSAYLGLRIEHTANIRVMLNTEIKRMLGDGSLNAVELVNRESGEEQTVPVAAVFSFIGATPRTDWLGDQLEVDDKGFVKTGMAVTDLTRWPLRRQPFHLETSRAGVFAAGDVRSGSVKRVASAVGEGSMAVQFVHEYLKEV